jgi:hypothetical protein
MFASSGARLPPAHVDLPPHLAEKPWAPSIFVQLSEPETDA